MIPRKRIRKHLRNDSWFTGFIQGTSPKGPDQEKTMRVGCPKEIKNHEYRVGLTPGSVREYVAHGHEVLVETGAGAGINADDTVYAKAGAEIVGSAADVFARSNMKKRRSFVPPRSSVGTGSSRGTAASCRQMAR